MKARVLNQASAGVWLYLPQPDANMMEAVRAAAEKCGAGAGMFGPDSAGMRVADILSRRRRFATDRRSSVAAKNRYC